MMSYANLLPYILDNIDVLIYSGQDDLIVNTPSTQAMIANLNWQFVANFQSSSKIFWKVNKQLAGYVQKYESLTYVFVINAGHMVTHYQPLAARDMVYRFIKKQGWQ